MKKTIICIAVVVLLAVIAVFVTVKPFTKLATTKDEITEEMAYEGVNNYCHQKYDWSIAKDNPEIMYVTKGESTETEYKITFRSYTGAFIYFYVNKDDGNTKMVEFVPTLNTENEIGTINIKDYLKK